MKLFVDPGGEWLLPFAKKRLRELKTEMMRLGQNFRTKWIQVSHGERIYLQSQRGFGTWIDCIRIKAGNVSPQFLYSGDYPDVLESPLFMVPYNNLVLTGPPTSIRDYSYRAQYAYTGLDQSGVYSGSLDHGSGAFSNWPASWLATVSPTNGIAYDLYGHQTGPNTSFAYFTESAESIAFGQALLHYQASFLAVFNERISQGMTRSDIADLAEDGHPTFTPPPSGLFADKEKIIVVSLEYTYLDTNDDLRQDALPTYYGFNTISLITITGAREYKYDVESMAWAFIKACTLYEDVGGERLETATVDHIPVSTTEYLGNVVFVSRNSWKKQGVDSDELESTYNTQMLLLSGPRVVAYLPAEIDALLTSYRDDELEPLRAQLLLLGLTGEQIDNAFDLLVGIRRDELEAIVPDPETELLRVVKNALFDDKRDRNHG